MIVLRVIWEIVKWLLAAIGALILGFILGGLAYWLVYTVKSARCQNVVVTEYRECMK